jgi:hypothetical protein
LKKKNHCINGFQEKVDLVDQRVGLTVILAEKWMVRLNVNRAVDKKVKSELSTHLVDQHRLPVKIQAKVKNGVRQSD